MNETPRRDWIVLVILILIGVALGVLQNSNRNQGRLDPITSITQSALKPTISAFNNLSNFVTNITTGIKDAQNLRQENQKLKQQIQSVAMYTESAERLNQENQKLKELLQLDPGPTTKVSALIIAYVPYDSRVTISAGKNKGLTPNLPVVNSDGLLGVISTVDETTSQVVLLTSSSVTVGGLALSNPPSAGLVRGESTSRLVMDITDKFEIEPGATVITTGYSPNIPRGIKIGTILEVISDQQVGVRRAFLLPATRIGLSTEVVVLK